MRNAYDRLCYVAHINDPELKFENVMGYISGIELKLDTPWEDSIEIKNYKTKFEDLFTSIVASTMSVIVSTVVVAVVSVEFFSLSLFAIIIPAISAMLKIAIIRKKINHAATALSVDDFIIKISFSSFHE